MTARKLASNIDANGLKVVNLGAPTNGSNDAARKADVETAYTNAVSRANHSGTQLAATISDFDTQVRSNRLDQLTAPTGNLGLGNQKIVSLGEPTADADAATKGYVDAAFAGVSSGQVLKGAVLAADAANVDISSAPATIDGLTPTSGDVVLLYGQSTGTENGPYVYDAAGNQLARPANWDSAGEAMVGSYWIVTQGTKADKFALMTNDTFTLGTDTATFVFIGPAVGGVAPIETALGDGAATSFAITHSFGTRAVTVSVYRTASPYDEVDVYVERTDLNTVTVKPDAVWGVNEFTAVVAKL